MENLGVVEIAIIVFIILIKFGLIIGLMLWSKSNSEKKKRLFLAEEQRKKAVLQQQNLQS